MIYENSRILDNKKLGFFCKKDFNRLLAEFKKNGYFIYKNDDVAGCNEIQGDNKVHSESRIFGAILMHNVWNVIFYRPELIKLCNITN